MFGTKPTPQPKCVLETINLDFDTLLEAKKLIDAEVAKRSVNEMEAAKSRLQMMASAMGISLAGFFGKSADKKERKKRKQIEAKQYVNPDDPTQIYKGKGRRPEWLQAKIDAGHDQEEFAADAKREPLRVVEN